MSLKLLALALLATSACSIDDDRATERNDSRAEHTVSRADLITSEQVRTLKAAQWDGFRRLAATLPEHEVLGIELIRTFDNGTAAVITVVRDGAPARTVIFGDERGAPLHRDELTARYAELSRMATSASGDDGDVSPDFALGQPPVHQPPTPGLTGLGSSLLTSAFDSAPPVSSR